MNITTDNISARHLLNIQWLARRKKSAFIRSNLVQVIDAETPGRRG